MSLPNNKFEGILDGKTIYDFSKKLDINLKQKDRIKLIQKILYTQKIGNNTYLDKYFEKFFEQQFKDRDGDNPTHFNVNITRDTNLSSKNNVCQALESMANYILFSPEAERINKKTKYNFYTSKKLKYRLEKEKVLSDMVNKKSNENQDSDFFDSDVYGEVIDFLVREGENYKRTIKQKIFASDYIDKDFEHELKIIDKDFNILISQVNILREYQDSIDSMKVQLDELRKNKENIKLQRKLIEHMKQCKIDQYLCKNKIKGTIFFKRSLPDSSRIAWEDFDYFDEEQVMCMMKFLPTDGFINNLETMIYDFNQLLSKIYLTPTEKEVLKLYRNEDEIQENIANKLGVTQPYIFIVLDQICKKIINKFENIYEDWYYLNICKGQYKTCSKCKNTKILNERHFGKHPNTKDGFYPSCKKCRSNNED